MFLDSEDLTDLRDLFDAGVRCSDVLVVLCTASIALRCVTAMGPRPQWAKHDTPLVPH